MDIQSRIALDHRAERIHTLYKRCHARFIQSAFAFRLVNDRIEPLALDDPDRKPLADVLDRSIRSMAILNERSVTLARAYVTTIVPSGVRNG